MSVVDEKPGRGPEHRGCLVVSSAVELGGLGPEVTDPVLRPVARMEEALTACIRQGQRDGVTGRGQDARLLGQYLLNSTHGLRVLDEVVDRPALSGIVDQILLSCRRATEPSAAFRAGSAAIVRIQGAVVPVAVYVLGLTAFCIGTTEFVATGLLPDLAGDLSVSIPAVGLLISGCAPGVVTGRPVLRRAATRRRPPPPASARPEHRLPG